PPRAFCTISRKRRGRPTRPSGRGAPRPWPSPHAAGTALAGDEAESKGGIMPKRKSQTSKSETSTTDLPSTLERSSPKAQRTWRKTHDSAAQQYGDGERAHRTAYAALKHSFQKKGGRWVAKEKRGPSDPRAAKSQREARQGRGETFGGVDFA